MTVGTHRTSGTGCMGITGGTDGTEAIAEGRTRGAEEGSGGCAGSEGCEATPWAELAAEMRRIKSSAELSYGQLAQRTHYSRSSWERFLNQKQLPTRIAVEQFAAASGQDPRPLLIRLERSLAHETAARTGVVRTEAPLVGAAAGTRSGGGPGGDRPEHVPPLQPLGLVVVGALVGGLATLLARANRARRLG
ncbi:helix-turn-helix transcriptional regulator [Streptomyces sp. NPDC001728]|uniref:helix-turn-helix domain-containing protein n=1 Tax=Streptomyces sp. NPDC001728 TaxID=3154396 RepID=UPI003316C527